MLVFNKTHRGQTQRPGFEPRPHGRKASAFTTAPKVLTNIVLLTRPRSNSSFLTRKTRSFWINTTFSSSPQSSLQETTRAAYGKERLDDDKRSPFKKRFEYIEHGIYHSFQLNYVLTIRKSRIRNPEPERQLGKTGKH